MGTDLHGWPFHREPEADRDGDRGGDRDSDRELAGEDLMQDFWHSGADDPQG